MKPQELLHAIDACRPGQGDERLPELAPLAERLESDESLRRLQENLQRLDAAIAAAMQSEIELPAGLTERLLAAAQSAQAATSADSPLAAPAQARPSRISRRRLLLTAGGSVAAAALLAVAAWQLGPGRALLDPQWLADQAPLWWQTAEREFGSGEGIPLADEAPPLPVSRDVRPKAHHWRLFPEWDSRAVVFDLTPPGEESVLLFSHRPLGADLSRLPAFPANPRSASQGLQIGVWQNDGVVYVLVVKGGERRFRQMIGAPSFA